MNKRIFIIIGIIPFILSIVVGRVFHHPLLGLSETAFVVAGLALWMGIWWISECVSIYITGLVPIAVASIFGLGSVKDISSAYFSPIIFLFFGGFIIGVAIEKWSLQKRIAQNILKVAGTHIKLQLAGFMVASAFLSMWISNTTTTVMLIPTVSAFLFLYKKAVDKDKYDNISKIFLLAVAYSATIGGAATIIGTPPNAVLASYMAKAYNIHISFAQWIVFGLPISIVTLFVLWVYLTTFKLDTKHLPKFSREDFDSEMEKLPPMSKAEKRVIAIIALIIVFWVFKSYLSPLLHIHLNDAAIAMFGSLLLFICPSGKTTCEIGDASCENILAWLDIKGQINYGVLFLFGGGIALAGLFVSSGLSAHIAHSLRGVNALPMILVILIIVVIIKFLTEVTSNTATAATFLPLITPIAVAGGVDPLYYAIPVALSAGFAFMLPVATPPNAIVFGTGQIKIQDMVKTGFLLNIFCIIFLTLYSFYLISVNFL